MSNQEPELETIFLAALEISSPSERDAFLKEQCGDNAELRRQVDTMLAANADMGSFLDQTKMYQADPDISEKPGTTIGPYKLLEQIGEGGMGVVYIAEQCIPIKRRVALKIIKPGMDTKEVMARFAAERQALALMEHPNIAKVLDAGETEKGRPFFVMELVRGASITHYCDQNKFDSVERLRLFVDVCKAIQHAHQKGVIHRDIKPSNVLVTSRDGKPFVKVIDFGVAKAINQQLSDQTVYTKISQIVGTPLYMSPEQADTSSIDIDTRTDIYSLGVLLYELLTGTTPFDKEQLKQAAFNELQRIIREEDPPKPSTKISSLGADASDISINRKTDARTLSQSLRGDLDWIVMKALEKDRTRRYETANGFAKDVERYLNDEAVDASPPSTSYKVKKFIRRNRAAVVAASIIAAVLVMGLAGTTMGMLWAWTEMVRADEATNAERSAKIELEGKNQQLAVARDQAESRLDLAINAIDDYRLAIDEHLDVKYRPELDELRIALLSAPREFYAALRDDLSADDEASPEQHHRLAEAYSDLAAIDAQVGSEDRALQSLQSGLEIAEQLEQADPANIELRMLVGRIHNYLGNVITNGEKRLSHYQQARNQYQQLVDQNGDLVEARFALASAQHNLGQAFANVGQNEQALESSKASADSYNAALVIEPDNLANRLAMLQTCHTVARLLLINRSEPEQALEWTSKVTPEANRLAERHPDDIEAQRAYALLLGVQSEAYRALGQFEPALEKLNSSQEIWEALSQRFPTYTRIRYDQANGLGRTAQLLMRKGQPKLALTKLLAQRALLQQLVDKQPSNLMYRGALQRCMMVEGAQYYKMGDKRGSLKCFEQLIPLCEETLKLDSAAIDRRVTLGGLFYNMATIRSEIGDPEKSLTEFKRALEIREQLANEQADDPNMQNQLAFTMGNIGNLYLNRLDDLVQAAVWQERARDVQRRIVSKHAEVGRYVNSFARTLNSLGTIYLNLNDIDKASEAYAESRTALEKLVAHNNSITQYRRDLAMAYWNHGLVLRRQENENATNESIVKALDIWRNLAEQHPEEKANRELYYGHEVHELIYQIEMGNTEGQLDLCNQYVERQEQLLAESPEDEELKRYFQLALRARAQLRAREDDTDGARKDYDQAVSVLDSETSRHDGLLRDALLAAWSGDLDEAEAEMQRIAKRLQLEPRQQFLLAKAYAVTAKFSQDDEPRKNQLADACLLWLQTAAENGQFESVESRNELFNGPSFAIVRDRPAFRELLQPKK